MKTNTKGNLIIFRLALTAIMLVSILALFPAGTAEAAPNLAVYIPTNLQASDGVYAGGIRLTFDYSGSNATIEIYRNGSPSGTGTLIGTKSISTPGTGFFYNDTTAQPGGYLYYHIRACDTQVCSSFSSWDQGFVGYFDQPTVTASNNNSAYISVSMYDPAADHYEVWRADSATGTKTPLTYNAGIVYNDTSAKPGQTYYYFVKTCNSSNQCSIFSEPDDGYRPWPLVQNVVATDGTQPGYIRVTWDAITGVDYYKVEYIRSSLFSSSYTFEATVSTGTTFDLYPSEFPTDIYEWRFGIRPCTNSACDGRTDGSLSYDTGYATLASPTNVQATDGTVSGGVVISMNAVPGGELYDIYRDTSSSGTNRVLVGTGTSVQLNDTDSTATPGVIYYYWVKACKLGRIHCGDYSAYNTGRAAFTPVTNLQASDGTYTSYVQLTWDVKSGATSYKVYRKLGAGSYILLGSPSTNSFQDSTAQEGLQYTYKVLSCKGSYCDSTTLSGATDTGYIQSTCYTINQTVSSGGSYMQLNPSASFGCPSYQYIEGEEITLTATPNTGWEVYSWSGTDDDNSTANTNTLTMPASNATVDVVYGASTCYSLTLTHSGQGTNPVANNTTNSVGCSVGYYGVGEIFSLNAAPGADPGWEITGWTGTHDNTNTTTWITGFTMPASNHTVSIVYEALCYPLTLSHTGQGGDPTATPTNSTGCSAGEYHVGESISLSSTPATGWEVYDWDGTSSATSNTLTMPASYWEATVNYTQICYTLTLSHTGNGGDPAPTPSSSNGLCGYHEYTMGEVISLTAQPDPSYQVSSWSGTSNDSSTSINNSVTMPNANHTVSVTYVEKCYLLTLSHTGQGSDPVATPSNSTGCSAGEYHEGESISLSVTPATGWQVLNWGGTSNNLSTSTSNTLIMPATSKEASVTYTPICYTLTVSHNGTGSNPIPSPTNSTGCGSLSYHYGEVISLTAQPDTGYQVGSWSGTDNDSSKANTNAVTMPATDRTVNVTYVVESSDASVDVVIGGETKGTYLLQPNTGQVLKYLVDGGPVEISGPSGSKIIASLNQWRARVGITEWTGVTQSMGLPVENVSNIYVMPRYDYSNPTRLYNTLLIANLDGVPRDITVKIGGPGGTWLVNETFQLNASSSVYKRYNGIAGGPVIVSSVDGAKIIASLYELRRDPNYAGWNGQSEMMGLPWEQLSDTYLIPQYFGAANPATLDARIFIANADTVARNVTVKIGGVEMVGSPYLLQPNTGQVLKYNLDGGPVEIIGPTGSKIIASLNQWRARVGITEWTGVTQSMALPANQVSNIYVMPRYDYSNPTRLYNTLLIANLDGVPRDITVKIGGPGGTWLVNETFQLNASSSVYKRYNGIAGGPVIVSSVDGAEIVASLYELRRDPNYSGWNGQSEMMGLPWEQLSDTYLIPQYFGAANPATLDARLFIAVP